MTEKGPAARTTRVMLVDDHADFRDLMVTLLGGHPDLKIVAQAGSMAEARTEAAVSGFDVAWSSTTFRRQ